MRRAHRQWRVIVLAAMLAGCASSPTRGSAEAGRTDRITREQIGDTSYPDLYQMITALRANWVRIRGPDNFSGRPAEVQVYLDDVRLGGLSNLRAIHPMEIDYVRYFDGVQASARWGFDHGSGVIYVATRAD